MFFNFKNFIILSLLLLANCAAPGSAFLGPTFTGVKTGSAYQASMSYGTGKVINIVKSSAQQEIARLQKLSLADEEQLNPIKDPVMQISRLMPVTTYSVKFSEVEEPEPLP